MGHPVVYFEIGCKDRAKTEHFFGELFDWKIKLPLSRAAHRLPAPWSNSICNAASVC